MEKRGEVDYKRGKAVKDSCWLEKRRGVDYKRGKAAKKTMNERVFLKNDGGVGPGGGPLLARL